MRLRKTTVGLAGVLVCLVVGASVAVGAWSSTTPAGGRIQLFVQPGTAQGKGKILLTGAIGDYGSSSPTMSSGGKKFGVATLQKGTIKIDLTAISAKVNKGAGAMFDAATCSFSLSETAPAPIISGTGAYAGIQGTIRLTETFGFIGSLYKSGPKKGQCNQSNNAPALAETGFVYGSGSVSF